jgi:hypothetical protein
VRYRGKSKKRWKATCRDVKTDSSWKSARYRTKFSKSLVKAVAWFEHIRRLSEVHDHLTATELKPGFIFHGVPRTTS